MSKEPIQVLCVDDNPLIAEGIRIKLLLDGEFGWHGHLLTADNLIEYVQTAARSPDIVLLDIDMPGRDAMDALADLSKCVPTVRTIVLSGYAREDFLDKAVEAGAWGYVSKNDGPDHVVAAIRRVVDGDFVFGPSVLQKCDAS